MILSSLRVLLSVVYRAITLHQGPLIAESCISIYSEKEQRIGCCLINTAPQQGYAQRVRTHYSLLSWAFGNFVVIAELVRRKPRQTEVEQEEMR